MSEPDRPGSKYEGRVGQAENTARQRKELIPDDYERQVLDAALTGVQNIRMRLTSCYSPLLTSHINQEIRAPSIQPTVLTFRNRASYI
jgi:hypothetical protein